MHLRHHIPAAATNSRPAPCPYCLPRRAVLAGLVAAASSFAVSGPRAAAQPAARAIDVHAHLVAPQYIQNLASINLQPPLMNWSIAKHLDDMEQAGVATSILSVTTPGVTFGDAARTALIARHVNDYAAKLVSEHKHQLGMFVAVPLPDPDRALEEIAYGLDVLKADGVGLFTSYGGGVRSGMRSTRRCSTSSTAAAAWSTSTRRRRNAASMPCRSCPTR